MLKKDKMDNVLLDALCLNKLWPYCGMFLLESCQVHSTGFPVLSEYRFPTWTERQSVEGELLCARGKGEINLW